MSKRKARVPKAPKVRNLVQAHVQDFNSPKVFEDRKARLKRGYEKHRGAELKKASWGDPREVFLMAA